MKIKLIYIKYFIWGVISKILLKIHGNNFFKIVKIILWSVYHIYTR